MAQVVVDDHLQDGLVRAVDRIGRRPAAHMHARLAVVTHHQVADHALVCPAGGRRTAGGRVAHQSDGLVFAGDAHDVEHLVVAWLGQRIDHLGESRCLFVDSRWPPRPCAPARTALRSSKCENMNTNSVDRMSGERERPDEDGLVPREHDERPFEHVRAWWPPYPWLVAEFRAGDLEEHVVQRGRLGVDAPHVGNRRRRSRASRTSTRLWAPLRAGRLEHAPRR